MTLRLQGYTLVLKYVKSEQNVCEYWSHHPYKDLLIVKELTHYVNFDAADATPNIDHIHYLESHQKS